MRLVLGITLIAIGVAILLRWLKHEKFSQSVAGFDSIIDDRENVLEEDKAKLKQSNNCKDDKSQQRLKKRIEVIRWDINCFRWRRFLLKLKIRIYGGE